MRELEPPRAPQRQVLPAPVVHADLAPATVLAIADQKCAAPRVEIALGEIEHSWIRRPARHSTTISPRSRSPPTPSPAWRMTATISSTRGGSAG